MMGRPTMIRGMHRAFIPAALSDSLANHGGFSGVAQVIDFVSAEYVIDDKVSITPVLLYLLTRQTHRAASTHLKSPPFTFNMPVTCPPASPSRV